MKAQLFCNTFLSIILTNLKMTSMYSPLMSRSR